MSDAKKPTLTQRALGPIDGLWLSMFRIGFGACMVWQIWNYFSTDLIYSFFIEPPHHFTFVGFDWVKPWPGDGMYLHFFVLGVAAMCILLGFYYRIACVVFWLGFTHFFLIDKSWYLNHYYLICLLSFLAIFLPANRSWSLDAWRYPEIRSALVPRWTLWLLRFQLGIPYFFGGLAKINRDWLHGEPMRTWLRERKDTAFIGQYFEQDWCVNGFVWGGMLLDLLVIPCLLWNRTRIPAMIAMVAFHLLNAKLFDIGVFPWLMLIATLVVFTPPEFFAKLRSNADKENIHHNLATPVAGKHRLTLTLLCLFASWQVLMPLRHFTYPGHTAFTRQGHHLAWRMKLNNLQIQMNFRAFDPVTRTSRPLSTVGVIKQFQKVRIRDVDQMQLLAGWLAEELPESDNPVQIRCRATLGLNGRPPQLLFDPELDLLSTKRTMGPADWINLYPEPLLLGDLDEEQPDGN